MLSSKHATLAIKILSLTLAALLSFFVVAEKFPETRFVKSSIESIESSNRTVTKLSAVTLSASFALSTLHEDIASPQAKILADINLFLVSILSILLFEKALIVYGIKVAFEFLIPFACLSAVLSIILKRSEFKSFSIRLSILALAVALVIPCSTHITNYVATDLTKYVEETIVETESGANIINDVMREDASEKDIFEKLAHLFKTALQGVSDLIQHFENMIQKCMNAIAILILTNFIMPLLTFFVLRWILKETFQIAIPIPPMRTRQKGEDTDSENDKLDSILDLVVAGRKKREE